MTCKHPDHDNPKLMCGHSLPCPYHTAIVDLTKSPATIEIPVTAKEALESRRILAQVGELLKKKALEEK